MFRDSGEEDAIPQAKIAPTMGAANTVSHAALLSRCEQAADRLKIEWSSLLNPADGKMDVYVGNFWASVCFWWFLI